MAHFDKGNEWCELKQVSTSE